MSLAFFTKDPAARLDYGFDWTQYLNGKTISASVWSVPSGLASSNAAFSATIATVILTGGTLGQEYTVTNQITASDGTIDRRSMTIKIQEK